MDLCVEEHGCGFVFLGLISTHVFMGLQFAVICNIWVNSISKKETSTMKM